MAAFDIGSGASIASGESAFFIFPAVNVPVESVLSWLISQSENHAITGYLGKPIRSGSV